jgi:hypothetical protein
MISTIPITIHIDPQIAQAYMATSQSERRKLDLLLSLQLSHLMATERSLEEVMREMSHNAQARGLTPDILDELLPTI